MDRCSYSHLVEDTTVVWRYIACIQIQAFLYYCRMLACGTAVPLDHSLARTSLEAVDRGGHLNSASEQVGQ